MLKKISNIPFSGTPEQEAALKAVIAECKGDKSLLMHVMQKAQEIYDYLPIEVQTMIAEGLGVDAEIQPLTAKTGEGGQTILNLIKERQYREISEI